MVRESTRLLELQLTITGFVLTGLYYSQEFLVDPSGGSTVIKGP